MNHVFVSKPDLVRVLKATRTTCLQYHRVALHTTQFLHPGRCPRSSHRHMHRIKRVGPVGASVVTTNVPEVASGSGGDGPAAAGLPIKARAVAVVPADTKSRIARGQDVTWEEVMGHEAVRLGWVDPSLQLLVFTDRIVKDAEERAAFEAAVADADVFLATDIWASGAVDLLLRATASMRTAVFLDSAPQLSAASRLGGASIGPPKTVAERLLGLVPGTSTSKAQKLWSNVTDFWQRGTSDDILFTFLVIVDSYVSKLSAVASLRGQGINNIVCMIRNCGKEVVDCVTDPDCKAGLDCLQACGPTDQVCSYRCIVSHESSKFSDFSLCVLQKHNCLGLDAQPPALPDPPPMTTFRGQPMTHDLAEQLFIGWLGPQNSSWRVVAGQNAAYDQFPCQYQLYFRGKAKGTFWYDPVFQVRTLGGELVWRRRHYRVRRAAVPATFHFSVLDNGVISKEFWRIVDVADDMSFALFAYSGAAAVAGQAYVGAVLCTPDGEWPRPELTQRVNEALERAGVKPWELFKVDNGNCQNAPLGIPAQDQAAQRPSDSLVAIPAPPSQIAS